MEGGVGERIPVQLPVERRFQRQGIGIHVSKREILGRFHGGNWGNKVSSGSEEKSKAVSRQREGNDISKKIEKILGGNACRRDILRSPPMVWLLIVPL